MPNQEIVGGLKSALNRGDSLEKAMLSFYNAGYKKEEIEDAVKFVRSGGGQQAQTMAQAETAQPASKSGKKVSEYSSEKPGAIKKTANGLIVGIIIAAILFVGLLIAFLLTS